MTTPAPENEPGPRLSSSVFVYTAMLLATVGTFWLIRSAGQDLVAPETGNGLRSATVAASSDALMHVLVALAVIIVVARAMGSLFKRLNQPTVIGEVIAGILLGPSLLGRVVPGASALLLPPSVAPYLGVIAQIGVILFMFLVGLHLDTGLLKKRSHTSVAIWSRRVSWGCDGVRGELVRHPEQFRSELNHVQAVLAEQSAIARMAPQVLGSVPSLRTQQGRCEKMNDELCGA